MLTKNQIDHAWGVLTELFKQILYAVNIAPYKNIHDQATQAIDLAAENERLKADRATFLENMTVLSDALTEAEAKLEEIEAECNKAMIVKNPLKHYECLLLFGDKLNKILAIIDKDGDT